MDCPFRFNELHCNFRISCRNSGSYDGDTDMDQKAHIRKTGKVGFWAIFSFHSISIMRVLDIQLWSLWNFSIWAPSLQVIRDLGLCIRKFLTILVFLQIVLTNPDMLHFGILPHHKVKSRLMKTPLTRVLSQSDLDSLHYLVFLNWYLVEASFGSFLY